MSDRSRHIAQWCSCSGRCLLFLILLFRCTLVPATAAEFGVAVTATPVLNTYEFRAVFGGKGGQKITTDSCGQVRELEYIALPGSVFTILKKIHSGTIDIYQVTTDEYTAPPKAQLFVDGRSLRLKHRRPAERKRLLPGRAEILSALTASSGREYVWGGNVPDGVPELSGWYNLRERSPLAGLDCSGLLYFATGGYTPRNTSQLISYGQGVAIAGMKGTDIITKLQPLDLIVWRGHVIIVLDRQTVIESRLRCGEPGNGGVVMTSLAQRISEIMRIRRPADFWPASGTHNDIFIVRRWYGEN
ncbi:MAG: NlpC/P60 family protein [Desulfuromonadaceae bacterium]|nr:NlpC/P60 family protein [Desulfuromonadaceae bacterium]MDD5104518.1 NlpC/P60 family protein [Desulfuromonadaceae bacterium]